MAQNRDDDSDYGGPYESPKTQAPFDDEDSPSDRFMAGLDRNKVSDATLRFVDRKAKAREKRAEAAMRAREGVRRVTSSGMGSGGY